MITLPHSRLNPIIDNIVRNSIEENFEKNGRYGNGIFGGGRTTWQRSRRAIEQSGQTLQDTGSLAASIYVKTSSTGGVIMGVDKNNTLQINTSGGYTVTVGSAKKAGQYALAAIHNDGATIPVTDRMKKFFWWQYKKSKKNKYKYMAMTKKQTFVIPPRPFLVLQDEDVDKIWDKYTLWLAENLK